MLKRIKIINFRSIGNMDLYFDEKINNIIWKNWVWKTNIIESISFVFLNNFLNLKIDELLKISENNIFLEAEFINENWINSTITFSYDQNLNKKIITLNWKKTSKAIIKNNVLKVCNFYPIIMNLFYLWPKYRRDFLDEILNNTFNDYEKILSNYDKVLKSRNKLLKNIAENKSNRDDIKFWDQEFIKFASLIYKYKLDLVNFIESEIIKSKNIFLNKINKIEFIYKTKTDLKNIENSIKNYLEKNLERDIILWKTHIWPHIDDFDILIDKKEIINFASRWEIKSIILNLKLLEIEYVKKNTLKTPILLIDDFTSELDEEHSDLLLNNIDFLQTIITSIKPINKDNLNRINII